MQTVLLWNVELQSYPGIPNEFSMIEGKYGYTINNNVGLDVGQGNRSGPEQVCLL